MVLLLIALGILSFLTGDLEELKEEWLSGKLHIGISAGASVPEVLVQDVIARLQKLGATSVRELDGISENVVFPIPKGLV